VRAQACNVGHVGAGHALLREHGGGGERDGEEREKESAA
jgi:hypothetical protein